MTKPLLFVFALAASAADFAHVHNVKAFGAAGDRATSDTRAIQKAIDSAAAAGGGTVWFPAGTFLSGTLVLRSNVTLHLSPGAVLLGSPRIADYSPAHLIFAEGVENVAIEGGGTIDGNGDAFFDRELKPLKRPSPLIEIRDAKNVRIDGVTVRRAPAWTIHPKNCDGVKIRGISLLNNLRAINSDGIDPDSCRNVIISDCHIEAGDDCIVLKTTNRGGKVLPVENVVVTNCVLVSAASALKLGTESHGDFRNCVFSNCVIRDSRTGIALLAKDGATMENIRFSNIAMTTAPKWGQGVEWPIVVDIEKRTAQSRLSRIRNIDFSDITIATKGRVMVTGLPESPIERISFRNIAISVLGYEEIAKVRKMRGGSHSVAPSTPDYGSIPAVLIFANANRVTVDNVSVTWPESADAPDRAVIYGDRLRDVRIGTLDATASRSGAEAVRISNSGGVRR
jgi:polygalacturonase